MRIDFEDKNDMCILHLEGRFVSGSDAEFLRTREDLNKAGHRKVLVDCRGVTYMDSTALNFVVGLYTSMMNGGGRFGLMHLNARVREVLRITHLDEIIPIFEDEQAAIASLNDPEVKQSAEQT